MPIEDVNPDWTELEGHAEESTEAARRSLLSPGLLRHHLGIVQVETLFYPMPINPLHFEAEQEVALLTTPVQQSYVSEVELLDKGIRLLLNSPGSSRVILR
mmetsp:Transcript_7454/g.21739  ORF Transcript_7454/g.21739 Transcript_7454/m.21739 type:complete len:101 (-) Transcript_7454:3588-3890(-)